MKSGIYQIRNTVNGKLYIGSSHDIKFRWKQHKSSLRRNKHHSLILQRAWNKYGEDCFEFEVIKDVEIESLIESEQFYFDMLNPDYNVSKKAGRVTHDEAFKQRLAERNRTTKKGRKMPEGWAEAHSLLMKGKPTFNWTDEMKKKLSDLHKGKNFRPGIRICTAETRNKLSVAAKGKPGRTVWTDEMKERASLAQKKSILVKHLWKWVTAQEINRIN